MPKKTKALKKGKNSGSAKSVCKGSGTAISPTTQSKPQDDKVPMILDPESTNSDIQAKDMEPPVPFVENCNNTNNIATGAVQIEDEKPCNLGSGMRLNVRSAENINNTVASHPAGVSNVVKVKTEKSEEGSTGGGISVIRASQLLAPTDGNPDNVINYVRANDIPCDVCGVLFQSLLALEDHRAASGHFKCGVSAECGIFQTLGDLSLHMQRNHEDMILPSLPMQQMTNQVRNIPVGQVGQMSPQMGFSNYMPAQNTAVGASPMQRQNGTGMMQRMPGFNHSIPSPVQRFPTKRPPVGAPSQRQPLPVKRRLIQPGGRAALPANELLNQLANSVSTLSNKPTAGTPPKQPNPMANLLASRGISVSKVPPKEPPNVFKLNSAVSILPASSSGGIRSISDVANDRLKSGRFTCQVCAKVFCTEDTLDQHLVTHGKKQTFKCCYCSQPFPTQAALANHKAMCHSESGTELGIPVLNMQQPETINRMESLGITHMLPLSSLGIELPSGAFGIPLLPFGDYKTVNFSGIGTSMVLPMGPLKKIN